MDVVGYLSSVFIGVALGLIGGGGSILTLPVLIYLFHVDVVVATAYSLFIVGVTSLIGSFSYFTKGLVNLKIAAVFGIPSIVTVFLTRAYLISSIPNSFEILGGIKINKNILLLVLFAILMIFAAFSMIKKDQNEKNRIKKDGQLNYFFVLAEGMIVGVLTGLVGAGGGFLIIPALVLFSKLEMKEAIGTSLVIIAVKSLVGFMGENQETIIDWSFLIKVTLFSIVGMIIGIVLSKKIDGSKLKPAFGWFVLIMGIYILVKEIASS